jgi:hypothetical protein
LKTLLEEGPVGVELFARLIEVSTVRRKSSLVVCDDSSTRGSRKAGNEFAACIARGYVLGLM